MERPLWQSPNCHLSIREDGIYLRTLRIMSPALLLEEIRPYIPFASVDLKALVQAQAPGGSLRIADIPSASSMEPRLEISPDGLLCFLDLPPGPWDPHTILDLCAREGVSFGVDATAVREARERATQGIWVHRFPIARGLPPRPGRGGVVLFAPELSQGPCFRDRRGHVESYPLECIHPVAPGQILGHRRPPEKGIPGRSVLGEDIAAPDGIPATPLLGTGVALRADVVVALSEGTLTRHGGVVAVEPLRVIHGDWGNGAPLLEHGHLLIVGHLRDGAEVEARGHVEVRGCIGRARVSSQEGNLTALWGVLGKGGAFLRAEGDIRARYVDEAILEARLVVVNEYISRSLVQARDGVKVEGRQGLVTASSIRAEAHVRARTVRATMPGDTSIEIRGICRPTLRIEYRLLPHRIRSLHEELLQRAQAIRTQTRLPGWNPETTDTLRQALEIYTERSNDLAEAQARLLELHDLLAHTRGDATLVVHDLLSSGTELLLKGVPWHPTQPREAVEAFVDSFSQALVIERSA